jgi:hypothetical protein
MFVVCSSEIIIAKTRQLVYAKTRQTSIHIYFINLYKTLSYIQITEPNMRPQSKAVSCCRALKTDQVCALKIDQGRKPGAIAPGAV